MWEIDLIFNVQLIRFKHLLVCHAYSELHLFEQYFNHVVLCIYTSARGDQWEPMIINSQVEFNITYLAFYEPTTHLTCLIGGSTDLCGGCVVPYWRSPRWYAPDDSSKYIIYMAFIIIRSVFLALSSHY